MKFKKMLLQLAVSFSLCVVPVLANAACNAVSSFSTSISTSGCYMLTGDLSTSSGEGLTISADNVLLDLNGYSIINTSGSGIAVSASNFGNLTVRNGSIIGYAVAIWSGDADGTKAGNLFTDLIIRTGNAGDCSIEDQQAGTVVKNNVLQGSASSPAAIGICAIGRNSRIVNNEIADFMTGIHMSGYSAVIDNNRIALTYGASGSIGINAGGATVVSKNTIVNFETGVNGGSSAGYYRENTAVNCTYCYSVNMSDGGNNKP